MKTESRVVTIRYTNYRGETAIRTIIPDKIWFGSSQWHPEPQWLMDAFDVEKDAHRTFALKDIHAWLAQAPAM